MGDLPQSTVTKCRQADCLNEGFTTFTPGRACSVSSVRGDRWRRFAKSTCPVRTHHVSFVLNHLECSHLRRITLFADYCAPTVHQNLAPIRPSATFLASHPLLLTCTESAFSGQVAWLRFCAIIEGRLGLWDYSFGDHAPISPGEGTVQSTNFEFSVPLRRV
jgi:hypothetical protein